MKKKTLRFLSVVMSAVTAFTFAGVTAPTTVNAAGESVALNATNFPDEDFRSALSTYVDTNKNGSLDADEIEAVTYLNIYYYGWSDETDPYYFADEYGGYLSLYGTVDATGVEYFTNLTSVYMYNVNNTKFDFSKMPNLNYLSLEWCYNLMSVNVDGLNDLYFISIDNCANFGSLDVSTNGNLNYVSCAGNDSFTSFTTSKKNKNLSSVYVYGPSLKKLDLSKLSALTSVAVCDCDISLNSLGIKNKNKITELYIRNNKKSGFVPSDYKNLFTLEYSGVGATSLDLSKNKKIQTLNVHDNSLKSIDVSGLKKLWSLDVSENKLSKLDVSKNKKLSILNFSDNGISKIDLSKNKNLYEIYAYSNRLLEKLDLSKCPYIYYFSVPKDVTVTIPKDKYTLSYYDYNIGDYKTKKLKSNSFSGNSLNLDGGYVSFTGKDRYVSGYFTY